MAYSESTQALIGNTPIIKLTHIELPDGVNLFAKLELYGSTYCKQLDRLRS